MIYNSFKDLQLSSLGMGNMRLPVTGSGEIDEKQAMEMIEYAYSSGINYYDTAYVYHGGESERFIGRALKQFPRDSWYLASKMPGHMMRYENGKFAFSAFLSGMKPKTPSEIFEEQLEKCQVDYFDFYLLHNVFESSYDFYTDENIGIAEYLLEQKKAGRIKHLGLSSHATAETIDNFLNWKDGFEFVQIQLNYLDWVLQDAAKKYEVITKHNIPVIVMEPCRGGKLASLDGAAGALLKNARPDDSYASWAFRFLQALPNVAVVLSGMSNMDQLKDNVSTFSKFDPVTEEEKALLSEVIKTMMDLVPCTACRYCIDGCPQNLDIPRLIALYNELGYEAAYAFRSSLQSLSQDELPSACVSCGACSEICPQGINVPEVMEKFDKAIAAMK